MCLAQGPQGNDACEARTCSLSVSSQALYNSPPRKKASSINFTEYLRWRSSFSYINRSKKRIKGQNFCQTIEYLSFHRIGYLSNDRYVIILSHFHVLLSVSTKTASSPKENKRLEQNSMVHHRKYPLFDL